MFEKIFVSKKIGIFLRSFTVGRDEFYFFIKKINIPKNSSCQKMSFFAG